MINLLIDPSVVLVHVKNCIIAKFSNCDWFLFYTKEFKYKLLFTLEHSICSWIIFIDTFSVNMGEDPSTLFCYPAEVPTETKQCQKSIRKKLRSFHPNKDPASLLNRHYIGIIEFFRHFK